MFHVSTFRTTLLIRRIDVLRKGKYLIMSSASKMNLGAIKQYNILCSAESMTDLHETTVCFMCELFKYPLLYGFWACCKKGSI